MIFWRHFILMMLGVLMLTPFAVRAQSLMNSQLSQADTVTTLFPIVPEAQIVDAPTRAISNENMKVIYDRCRSQMPTMFTPEALRYYCTCSNAAIQGTMTNGDLKEIQRESNRKVGNAAFEKFMTNVMKPCLDMPVEDMEYMSCIMYRGSDWRILYPIPYCRCTSRAVREHFEEFGLEEMMISWGDTFKNFDNPVEAIWDSNKFQAKREEIKDVCTSSFMDPQYLKSQ